ncbi:hypothetical protein, partial [Mesorhizobium sp.]|uniref:hypothetical protein n=1 Tax=Mesorhizobium sp. TaxID=1871066 RepID=UPI0025DBDE4D
ITGDAADMTPNRQAQQTHTQTDSRKSQNPARSDKTNPINVIKSKRARLLQRPAKARRLNPFRRDAL